MKQTHTISAAVVRVFFSFLENAATFGDIIERVIKVRLISLISRITVADARSLTTSRVSADGSWTQSGARAGRKTLFDWMANRYLRKTRTKRGGTNEEARAQT